MKYQFIKKDLDTYILKYGEKEIEFNTTIGVASRIQKYQEMAESKLIMDLASQGMTVNDLKVEKIKDGKKYIDESNYESMRKIYRDNAINEVIDEICLELFKFKLADLALELKLKSADEGSIFATKLMNCLIGGSDDDTPSKENKE